MEEDVTAAKRERRTRFMLTLVAFFLVVTLGMTVFGVYYTASTAHDVKQDSASIQTLQKAFQNTLKNLPGSVHTLNEVFVLILRDLEDICVATKASCRR